MNHEDFEVGSSPVRRTMQQPIKFLGLPKHLAVGMAALIADASLVMQDPVLASIEGAVYVAMVISFAMDPDFFAAAREAWSLRARLEP